MKIGIVSMHRVCNYGSFLQGYGLKKILEAQGHSVKFVDIEAAPRLGEKGASRSVLKKLRRIDRYFLKRWLFRKKRYEIADILDRAQQQYLGLEDSFSTAEGCDAVVIGSDEIFNCASKGPWKITAERFGDIPDVRRVISYAASCGYTSLADISEADMRIIEKGICRLDAVSVRDENTARFAGHFRQDKAQRHLDPVLIYDFAAELSAVENCTLPKQPYMVVYAYQDRINDPAEVNAIRAYAQKHGLRIIAVGSSQFWCDEFAVLTPFEVLAYFKNAACIVTDTFHGTVISAKYNKPFAVLVRDSNANKLEDLLTRLQLEAHAVRSTDQLTSILEEPFDYTECNQRLAVEKIRTTEYLRDMLQLN